MLFSWIGSTKMQQQKPQKPKTNPGGENLLNAEEREQDQEHDPHLEGDEQFDDDEGKGENEGEDGNAR